MKCSVYIVCPAVLSGINLKLHQTLEVKNVFKEEKIMLQLTINPGLTLTSSLNNPALLSSAENIYVRAPKKILLRDIRPLGARAQ